MSKVLLLNGHSADKVFFTEEMMNWKIQNGEIFISEKNQISLRNALKALTMLENGFEVKTNMSANLEQKILNVCCKTWINFFYLEIPIDQFDIYSIEEDCMFQDSERWGVFFVDLIINKTNFDKKSANNHLYTAQEKFNKQNSLTTAILAAVL